MQGETNRSVFLSVATDPVFLPLVTSFVENGAIGLGLGKGEALSLTLATEEIFSYLCQIGPPDQPLEIRCAGGGYYVRADFRFTVEDFNMRAFNLTATISPDDETSLQEMGLLIASRAVERLHVERKKGGAVQLSLTKEKKYPKPAEEPVAEARPLSDFSIRRPEPEEAKLFALLVNRYCGDAVMPDFFRFPGKFIDMVQGGECDVSLAVGPDGHVGGGIIWYWAGLKTVDCFGPCLFNQGPDSNMAEALLESCLGAIARTHAVGLINRYPTRDLPLEHFEPLGSLTIFHRDDSGTPLTAYFRQMQEDPGTAVWSHARLVDFLREEYTRMVLPREIRQVKDLGETRTRFSVLSAEFERSRKMVTLRPIRSGIDAGENLGAHLRLFAKESLRSVFFEMDLGEPWQAEFTPGLLDHGFTPRLILPYAGKSDIAIFQLGDSLS